MVEEQENFGPRISFSTLQKMLIDVLVSEIHDIGPCEDQIVYASLLSDAILKKFHVIPLVGVPMMSPAQYRELLESLS